MSAKQLFERLADASEITGLPRDNFEVWEITREEFEEFRDQ